MTAQELKNSILQLAIQGKLVEQRAEEGTTEQLYHQIQEEKARLITEGKIKKDKPLPAITEDEIPFDIPENWKWVRIMDILQIINGDRGKNYPSKDKLTDTGIPFISAVNIDNQTISKEKLLCMTEEQYEKLGSGKLILGDLVLCIRGSLGKNGRYPFEKGAIASSLVILRSYIESDIFYDFITTYINSGLFSKEVNKYNNGTAQPNLGARDLAKFILPLPPLEEQKRIMAKIEELMPYVEQYDKAYTKLEAFNKKFPEDMQKSILQYAIQGKLVEQRAEEGTAEELYKQIQGEKEMLIKEKKIKKEKSLPEITEDEMPFEIPESWKWVRLGQIGEIVGGGTPKTNKLEYWENGNIPWLTPADMKYVLGKYVSGGERNITQIGLDSSSARLMPAGTVLYSSRAPIGYIAIAKNEICTNQGFKSVVPVISDLSQYIYYCLIARTSDIISRASGTTFKEISGNEFGMTTIPLPPLEEQKRIIAKIEEILPYCHQLLK